MVDKQSGSPGKGRATPSRKEAEAARKKQMKAATSRKELQRRQRAAREEARAKAREAMKTGDDRYLPPREKGPVRRFTRDFVDARLNVAEFLLVMLVVIFIVSFAFPGAATLVTGLWIIAIIATVIDEYFMLRGLRKELRKRFTPAETRGTTAYALLRTTQIRRLRQPKPQVKRGEKLRERY